MIRSEYFSLTFVLVLFLTISSHAREHFDSWTTADGLPQNSVRKILQSADGYLWFTTLDGLVRFDGVKFTVFNKANSKNLPTSRLIDLITDSENALWICTEEGGLVRYRNGEFQSFTTADGLPSNTVYEVLKDTDDSVLAFTRDGIARFADNRFAPLIDEKKRDYHEFRIYPAPSGIRWELTAQSLTAEKDGDRTIYNLPQSLKSIFFTNFNFFYFVKMFEDREGTLWIWLASGKLFKFRNGVFDEITAAGMPASVVRTIAQDRQGAIWLGTEADGACRLASNKFACFNSTNGFSSNFVTDIMTDREGTLWIATNDKGISRLTKQVVTSLSTAENLPQNNVYSILEDRQGAIWIGSFGAVAKSENGVIKSYGKPEGLIYTFVQSLFKDADGRLWIGGLDGVQYFEDGKFHDFMGELGAKPGDFTVYDIHRDRQQVLWFATTAGLIGFDGQKVTRLTKNDGLAGDNVKTVLEAQNGALWIGTFDGLSELKDGKITSYTEKDGLAGNHIRSLYEDETGALWIGTYESGLSRFKDEKFTVYTKESGLFSNGVFQILPDDSGNFWMSSNQGIYRVSRQELNDYADGLRRGITSTAFGKSDGMRNPEANGGGQPAGTRTRDGRLWFPTQDGVAIVDPETVAFNPLPPPVVVENVRIDNEKLRNFQAAIDLNPGQENLEIDYTGLSFIKSEQVRFRYRLEGLDENWTEAGSRRTAFFTHLPPGEYTFRVTAANSENIWNEQGTSVKIRVKPPFYRTWWFYAACLLVFLTIVYLIYRVRISRLEGARRAQEEFSRRLINVHETERRRIAAELHDSIGQSLALIKNRAVLGSESVTDENARRQLDLITAQTAQTISEVREISYNLRPYLLDNLGLTKAVKSQLDRISETSKFTIHSEIDEIDDLFDKEAEMSIYRIIQESLSNVIKHAAATEVNVMIRRSTRSLSVAIIDNGKGFDAGAMPATDSGKSGFGLLGISERVRYLGGMQEIETEIGKGTTVFIRIPLSERK